MHGTDISPSQSDSSGSGFVVFGHTWLFSLFLREIWIVNKETDVSLHISWTAVLLGVEFEKTEVSFVR